MAIEFKLPYTGNEISAKLAKIDNLAEKSELPTKTSDLTNDSGFITGYVETDPTVPSWAKSQTKPSYTATEVGADASGTADSKVSVHNTSNTSHNDIRELISGLTTRLNTLADSDDTTLDQLSEIVAYIKTNKNLIDSITTNKVNVSDIIDNLTTNVANKPLSAKMGVELKNLIDAIEIPTSLPASDVSAWAKASTKPSYTKSEVGLGNVDNVKQYSASNPPPYPVTNVNNKTGDITLSASDVGADASGTASSAVGAHNTNTSSHSDIREQISQLSSEIADLNIPTVTQEAGESESLVMSQKAVTDLVAGAIGGGGTSTEYETVDSVDQMIDTSKQYVLKETGTLWSYSEQTIEVEPPNKFVPSTATLNNRMSGSSGSVSANDTSKGSFVTDFIAVSGLDKVTPYNVRFNWILKESGDNKALFYNSSKTRIGSIVFAYPIASSPNTTVLNNETIVNLKATHNGEAVNVSDWSQVAYVRLQAFVKPIGTDITSADIENLTIKFDAEGGTKTEAAWYDTGLKPSESGGNYVDLLVKVNQNKTDITEVSNRVTALETENETVTIPSFWKSAVDACISKIKSLQVGRNCVTFPFFSDNHQRNGYAGMLIAHIMKECNIPYAFFGGDSIDSGYIASEAVMIAQDKAFDTSMSYIPNGRFCRAVGNHDGYWAVDANNKNYYTDAQNYELFLREESIAQNKHFGGDGTYYYIDDIASKVRFVVLDTNDGVVEAEQISWLQNTALSFAESGWSAVFISHQPISNHYHANISNAAEVRAVVSDYINGTTANKADVIGWFSGHIHRDRIYTGVATNTTDDTVGAAMGFTQVTITSDHTGIAYDDATKHTVANDDLSHAIDFVTVNKATRTVNITRLGIGNDRSYSY